MSTTSTARTAGRRAAVSAGALAAALALGGLVAPSAVAAPAAVEDATLAWSINDESGGGAFFGGCNFLSAGEAGNTGSSRLWTESDGFYSAAEGNVSIRKPDPSGAWVTPTWSTKCHNRTGGAVNTQAGSTTESEVVFSGGTGTVDVDAGTAQISWDGAVTIVYYGGLTYWTITDPVLTVADGTGIITGTASGYGADMFDPSLWVELTPREITVANLSGLEVSADGFTVTPDYLGVEVEIEPGGPSGPQVRTGANWGGFPQSWVDFNAETGQAAYWYSSGGAVDPKKPTNPLTVSYTVEDDGDPGPGPDPEPGEGEVIVEVEVPESEDPGPGEPGEFSWVIDGDNVNLGQAVVNPDNTFSASGTLPTVTVTDTREDAPAWSLTGQSSAFTGGQNSFTASALGWVPSVGTNPLGAIAGDPVAPGAVGLSTAQVLVEAPGGHGTGSVEASAVLNLLAPADTPAGSYTSIVTLDAIG